MLFDFIRDVRQAIRSFARRPLFTAVLLVTLALGIGSNVAIFSVANAVLFRPLPYAEPHELALVWTRLPATNVERSLVSGPDFQDYREEAGSFEDFAGAAALAGTLTGEGPAEQVMAGYSTWNLFRVLGVQPLIGRSFEEDDAFPVDPDMFGNPDPDLPPGTVMLTHGLWQRRYGSDPSIVGKTIQLDGWGSVVVGVLPPDFRIYLPADAGMPTNIDIWGVLPSNVSEFNRDTPWLTVVGRMNAGVTEVQAQQEMDALAARLRAAHPFHATQNLQIVVAGMHGDVVRHARPAVLALLGAVGFVLLIACANIANLLLVRASGRGREIAVRAALGSGRGRIIRQMLTESAVLAAGGALLGVLVGWYGVRVVRALSPGNLPRVESIGIDGRVLAFTAVVAALAALLFGLAPALRAVGGNLADALKDRGSDAGGVRGNKLRTGLVVTEVALSLVLLIGAGLLVRSFQRLQQVDPGFEAQGVVSFAVPLSFLTYYSTPMRVNFMNELADGLSRIPGVESVGGVTPLPLSGGEQYSVGSYGRPGDPDERYQAQKADFRSVMPGYFETLRIQLVAGRAFLPSDNQPEALDVAVIDEKLARRVFGDEDPIGKELLVDHFNEQTFTLERLPVQVVGVAADVRSTSLAAEGRETVYVPYVFSTFFPMTFTVRTAAESAGLLTRIREEVTARDPDVPVADLTTVQSYVDNARAEPRFMLALIGTFAGLALLLAALGLYGVMAYSARQRTREIGVRMAFGADRGVVVRLLLSQGMLVASAGVVLGLGAALALTRVVRSLLVEVSATDPVTFVGVPVVLLGVAALASYVPARRAAGIDPVSALRDE